MQEVRHSPAGLVGAVKSARSSERGSVRVFSLVAVCLAAGFAGGALWYRHATKPQAAEADSAATARLSDTTQAVLKQLDSPVEIRFYALLDPENVPDSLRSFARRVDQMLSAFEQTAAGKLTLIRHTAPAGDAMKAAAAAGLRPLNLDSGDPCYLGLTVAQAEQQETLPRLAPEWAQALEFDLTRMIERVTAAHRRAAQVEASAEADKAATEAMKRSIPNVETVSAEAGAQMLREAGLKEFKAAAGELEAQVKQAEDNLVRAQNGGTQAEQETARRELLQLHAEQAAKFKEIAARYQTQIDALERLKAAGKQPQTRVPTNAARLPTR